MNIAEQSRISALKASKFLLNLLATCRVSNPMEASLLTKKLQQTGRLVFTTGRKAVNAEGALVVHLHNWHLEGVHQAVRAQEGTPNHLLAIRTLEQGLMLLNRVIAYLEAAEALENGELPDFPEEVLNDLRVRRLVGREWDTVLADMEAQAVEELAAPVEGVEDEGTIVLDEQSDQIQLS